MRHVLIWSISGVFIVALTIVAVLPAGVLVQALENQTGGRITLGDPQGSVWQGSAFVGAAMDSHSAVSPMLPGRFSWQLSPLVLLGRVDAVVQNSEALSAPLSITGDWRHWRFAATSRTTCGIGGAIKYGATVGPDAFVVGRVADCRR